MPAPFRPLPLWAAALAAGVSGYLLTLAFPALSWWPMVFVAIPLALVTLIGRRAGGAFLVGLVFGAAFFLVNVSFTARYLGPVPWLALSLFEAVLTGLAAIPIALAYRWIPRVFGGRWARLVLLPALIAGLWTARELLLGTFPYGGFPWGRVGISQANGPLVALVSWTGVSGLTFAIVFVCASLVELVRAARTRPVLPALPAVAVAALLVFIPAFPTTDAGIIRIGAVQGNGPAGYFDDRGPNAVTKAQLEATVPLLGEDMDLLVWPEGGVDSDPTHDAITAGALDLLAQRVNAPLLVSAVTQRGEEYFNSALLWEADADNPVQTYDKRHPVPFGEYVPDRWFYNLFAPDLIGLIQREYTAGTAAPVFDIDGVPVGLAICFDVIYDDVIRDGAREGAEVFVFQTNNADFRGTDENLQQLAFARVRAIETGRAVVNLSTVGTSQIIAPDGSEIAALPVDTAGVLLEDVPLRTGSTPGVVAGLGVDLVLGWGSLLALAGLGLASARRRRIGGAGSRGSGTADSVS